MKYSVFARCVIATRPLYWNLECRNISWAEEESSMLKKSKRSPFPVGSRIRVMNYSPFRGLKGTIRSVDTIPHLDEPFCFYQVELEGALIKEPIWFEYDEIELVSSHNQT
jgi:hypothetical protein